MLGLSFITEGAIPFAAKDPLRVIPAAILGSAAAGALSMYFAVGLRAPHGGVFVLAIPNAVTHLAWYALAIVVGTAADHRRAADPEAVAGGAQAGLPRWALRPSNAQRPPRRPSGSAL